MTYEHFQDVVAPYISRDKIILDAGCGKAGINDLEPYRLRNKLCLGLDASFKALQIRTCFDFKIQGVIEQLPFRENSIDAVISHLVFEHLKTPELAIQEFSRILKNGGAVIITTNSIFHPVMFLSYLLPLKIRDWIKKHFLLIHDDSFPTYYRFNSLARIEKIMARYGFARCFATYSSSLYSGEKRSSIDRILSKLFNLYNQITTIKWLRQFSMNIVVHYAKI